MLIEAIPNAFLLLDVYAGNTQAVLAFRGMGFMNAGKIEFRDYGYRQSGLRMSRTREQKIRLEC
jgi:hypothetical protein